MNAIKERVVSSVKDSVQLQHMKLSAESRRLSKLLLTLPANLTASKSQSKPSGGFDCRTYAYALRQYFIDNQEQYAIRRVMISSRKQIDLPLPLDKEKTDKQIEVFRCRPTIKTDQSIFHYFKYLVESFRFKIV